MLLVLKKGSQNLKELLLLCAPCWTKQSTHNAVDALYGLPPVKLIVVQKYFTAQVVALTVIVAHAIKITAKQNKTTK